MQEEIVIRGAKENNLKNIDVRSPRNKLTVLTGLSGSGKSTLAFDTLFAEGQTVRGIIRSVESYGVFVELRPNLAGLAEFRDDVRPGQTAAVYIKSIIPEKMKIKLIIIDAHDAPENPEPLEYFIDTDSVTHIDSWLYSPPGCRKVIESVF